MLGDGCWEFKPFGIYLYSFGFLESLKVRVGFWNIKMTRQRPFQILKQINPQSNIEKEISDIESEKSHEISNENIFLKKYRKPLLLAFFIAFFNQVSGINAFLYYAPRIFELAGLEKSASFLSSIGIGLINLIFTLVGISLIDKYGRKKLMYIGSTGYIISLGLISIAFLLEWKGFLIPLFFFCFHYGTCYRSGCCNLGVYFRNIPE